MIEALSPYFPRPLEDIGAFLTLERAPSDILLTDFLEEGGLAQALSAFAQRFDEPHPQATASQWSKLYFSRLLPAALLPGMLGAWQLPLSPSTLLLRLDPDGAASMLVLANAGKPVADAGDPFGWLIRQHLTPVITALSETSGLPRKVLWNNAGNLLEGLLAKAQSLFPSDHPGLQAARHLIATRMTTDDRPNPLYEPVRYRASENGVRRVRKLCCLRYLTPSLGLCSSCPRPRAAGKDAN